MHTVIEAHSLLGNWGVCFFGRALRRGAPYLWHCSGRLLSGSQLQPGDARHRVDAPGGFKSSGFSDIKYQFMSISATVLFFNAWVIFNYKKTT